MYFCPVGQPRNDQLDASVRRTRIDNQRRWFPNMAEFIQYRHLTVMLGRRDITVRYRQTVLGTLWIFTGPLVSAGLFSLVFGRVASLPSDGVPYFVFSYAGLLTWSLFSGILSSISTSVASSSALITKVYFPRLVVPFATLPSTLLNTAISFVVMLVLLAISGVGFSLQILVLPVWLLLAMALSIGLGLIFTSAAVWYRDVNYLTPLLIQLLLFLSPVAYSLAAVPDSLHTLYLLNPLTTVEEGTRWSLLGGSALPPAWAIVYSFVVTTVTLVVGLAVFARSERGFADVV